MAQVPASYSPYGEECRKLWTIPKGYKLVGCDASGLELRMLAHYMNDYDYTEEVISGDIHTANQKSAGLATRDQAKTFIYAFLYGAGDEKIGTIVGGGKGTGRTVKKKFLDNTPALKSLRERVTLASKRGYLIGLDGRRIWVRSEHSALNSLLQGAGAIIMKKALVLLDEHAILKPFS
jgi:DNA polymerase I-like protein with 3'-5' exonuclease and polymerase domains